MCDLGRWNSLSLLSPEFIDNLQASIVFGSSGGEVLMITKDDHVYAMGTNFCSCLGATSQGSLEPRRLDSLSGRGVRFLAFGAGPHVIAISGQGSIYSWGNNASGQLGLGHTVHGTSPMLVQGALTNVHIVSVACGGHHTVAVSDRGEVFAWGNNANGQLGIGSIVNQESPRLVPLHNRLIVSVSCGHDFTLALSQSGDVFAWGYNGNGQIGTGNECNQLNPFHLAALSKAGPITQIVCGHAHSLALSDQGQLFVWGSNSCGQLGANSAKHVGEPMEASHKLGRITEVAAIHQCNITVVATKSGKVFMWGLLRGQLVAGPVETRFGRVDDAFACFASPPVSFRMLQFESNRRTSILDAIRASFDDPSTSDLRVKVDGHTIHAHRALLKMRSQYFNTRLNGLWRENNGNDIEVSDFPYPIYRAFLNWLYTDELILDESEHAVGLLELANCYCESELKDKCALLLQKGISIDNAAQLYSIAVKLDVTSLEEYCFRFCLNHMTAVTQSESFRQLDDYSVKRLIQNASKEGVFKR